jgi:putative transcriptional regulator
MRCKGARTRDLAIALGVHINTASRLKRRRTVPKLEVSKLDALCEWLDCQPGDLIEYTKGDEKNEQRSPSVD